MQPVVSQRRTFLKTASLGSTALALMGPSFLAAADEASDSVAVAPRCNRIPATTFALSGPIESYLAGITEQWLKVAPFSNPAMLDMFTDRDRLPRRDMVPWAGEFAGKYLTSAVQVCRLRRDEALRKIIADFVNRLVTLQADDGYLGPWPNESRLTGHAPNAGPKGGETWDAWGHYHVMLGLLLWHDETGDEKALQCVRRIGDLFCRKFETARLVDTGSTEMNLAPIHSLCLLYKRTHAERYRRLALKICDEFAATGSEGRPLAGDYLNAALAGKEFFQMPKPRWESLHPIMALAELHSITGEDKYRRAFEHIWWSIVKLDRHNNGGFSSGEQAQGNPYHQGAIETCCTVAWSALTVEMLRLTGNSIVADELELSTLNSVVGLHSPTGRWVTYNTPMDGTRKASAHDIVFQARAGSPELNCCSVNGARGFGLISDWAVMASGKTLVVNWFGPCRVGIPAGFAGVPLTLVQETDYPRGNKVRLKVTSAQPAKFPLKLRIPHWSRSTSCRLNGQPVNAIKAGTYLTLDRTWASSDVIELDFDFSLHFWAGERECANKVSIYRGPLLLTYDRRFNTMDPAGIPSLDAARLNPVPEAAGSWFPPIILVEVDATDGRKVRLCDFGSAGNGGSPYRSWLDVRGVSVTPFTAENPMRTSRVA